MKLLAPVLRAAGAASLAVLLAAHVGSPNVFYTGKAGPYDIRVEVRPPDVVPGIARVSVRVPGDVRMVAIRPVFWRAGSRGAPPVEEMRSTSGAPGTFDGAIWLMARGAYSVDVVVTGSRGTANVLVPVAAVATGRLAMNPLLGTLLVVLGIVLCAGLVNIVHKAAGESLVHESGELDSARRARARRAAALVLPVLALALFGGARWWRSVDAGYELSMYRPSPLRLALAGDTLTVRMSDTLWRSSESPSGLVPDHGKLMHLFLVRRDDARAFAHLHPVPADTSELPSFSTRVPPLPQGDYDVYADVVHDTGFDRTLVGRLSLGPIAVRSGYEPVDADDAWFVGDATRERTDTLADGALMDVDIEPGGVITAGRDETIRVTIRERDGSRAVVEPYMGLAAHAVVLRVDGQVYVHLHPMGTFTAAAQQAFLARDRGDTTASGRLIGGARERAGHAMSMPGEQTSVIEFPYAFPKGGSYRLFVQVRRRGLVETGAFAVTVADSVTARGSAR